MCFCNNVKYTHLTTTHDTIQHDTTRPRLNQAFSTLDTKTPSPSPRLQDLTQDIPSINRFPQPLSIMPGIFQRGPKASTSNSRRGSRRASQPSAPWDYPTVSNDSSAREKPHGGILPTHSPSRNGNGNGNNEKSKVFNGIQPDGESGRRGFHPLKFLKICWKSASCTLFTSSYISYLRYLMVVAG